MVLEYLDNHGSYDSISQKHGMSSSSQLKTWVAAYQKFGDTGLKRSRSRKEYSFEEKLSVVESYLTSELSYQELALQMGINNRQEEDIEYIASKRNRSTSSAYGG